MFRYLIPFFIHLSHLDRNRDSPHPTPSSPRAQLGVLADHPIIFRAQGQEVALERRVAEGAQRHGGGWQRMATDGAEGVVLGQ